MKKLPMILFLGYIFISLSVFFIYRSQIEMPETIATWVGDTSDLVEGEEEKEENNITGEKGDVDGELQLMSSATGEPTLPVVPPTASPEPTKEVLPTATPEPTPAPVATATPTSSPTSDRGVEHTEENKVTVSHNGKEIGYWDTDYRMDEETLDRIVSMVRKEPYVSSFVLFDINSGTMISYNENRYYPVASTVKAPFVMTCLWQIEEGISSLEDTMEYTEEYSVSGDGVIKKEDLGTMFTVKELMEHAILISDDIGYLMLQGKFGHKSYNQFLKESGNKVTIDGNSVKWGQTSAMDSLRNWQEVYRYINSDSENAAFFAELIKNTNKSFIRNVLGDEYTVYNKMGWVYGQCCHDHAIVMDEQPYLMVIMTMGNARAENQKFMEELAVILNGVHEEMVSTEEIPAE